MLRDVIQQRLLINETFVATVNETTSGQKTTTLTSQSLQ